MAERSLILANGLRCRLIHQPEARQAAALLRVDAGSLQEPDRWPGLAHLLEHLLFADSAAFRGEERLMQWAQRRGGEVNASTRLGESAFFFQAGADDLAEGLARLVDMLAAPLLAPEAIAQEAAAIDAEYRLLQTHADTLCEAALFDLQPEPAQLARFRVGSRRAFGDNVTTLGAALRAFHRRYCGARNAALWLQGPQPLAELARMAERCGGRLPAGEARPGGRVPPALREAGRLLRLPGEARFWLTFRLSGGREALSEGVAQLARFWNDDAPGGLLARLREEDLCDGLDARWLWREARGAWLAIIFRAPALDRARAGRIERLFWQHLGAVADAGPAQREHYRRLAQEEFLRQAPLAQLRARALGFAPGGGADLDDMVRQLRRAPPLRLLTGPAPGEAELKEAQGFRLAVAGWRPLPLADAAPASFDFYPRREASAPPAPTGAAFPLLTFASGEPGPTLLLRPAFFQPLPDGEALALHRRLRPILGQLRHAGGRGEWRQLQGVWQLSLNLPEPPGRAALAAVAQLARALAAPAEPVAGGGDTIALRRLLGALDQRLISAGKGRRWMAAWDGTDDGQRRALAEALGALAPLTEVRPPLLTAGVSKIACPGDDAALALFMPLAQADGAEQAALRALGLIYAPRFYRRLREELRVGYAVFARYQQVADIDGILFAAQSPHLDGQTLLQCCEDFLSQQDFGDACLDNVRRALAAETPEPPLRALRQRFGLAVPEPRAIAALRPEDVAALHRRLLGARRAWRILMSGAGSEDE